VIEKHFTLDRSLPGPDHQASLEPGEMAMMVQGIRNLELALGNGVKTPTPSEMKNREIARKSIVAKGIITKGKLFSLDNMDAKRPGNGISPMMIHQLMGRHAGRDFMDGEQIEL
jgi:sialic acid synthase SpsE